MKINFSNIFKTQIKLDKEIHKTHNVNYSKVFEKLKLALLVELGELANEIRAFKFWSLKKPSDKHIILEEYVDVIHFITSICLYKKVDSNLNVIKPIKQKDLKLQITLLFNKLFKLACDLSTNTKIKTWYNLFIQVAFLLDFSIEDVINAYFKKNQINFKRQMEKY